MIKRNLNSFVRQFKFPRDVVGSSGKPWFEYDKKLGYALVYVPLEVYKFDKETDETDYNETEEVDLIIYISKERGKLLVEIGYQIEGDLVSRDNGKKSYYKVKLDKDDNWSKVQKKILTGFKKAGDVDLIPK